MSNISFSLDGLDDLAKDLAKINNFYPDEGQKAMKRMANRFVKDVQKREPSFEKVLATKKWKREVSVGMGSGAIEINITNNHPLHHLLENGHEKWFMGKHIGGWVAGKHYTEKTRYEWETDGRVAKELNDVCDYVFKKVNL